MEATMNFWYLENILSLVLFLAFIIVPRYLANKITDILLYNFKQKYLNAEKYKKQISFFILFIILLLCFQLLNIFYY